MEAEALSYNIATLQRMADIFGDRLEVATVSELSERRIIFVEDGNHGENRPRQDEFVATGIAFLRPPDLRDGRVDFQSCGRINEAGFRRVRKGIGRRGDIILTHRATVGRIAITDNDAPEVFVTNPGTTIWRSTNPDVLDQRYLYCFMRSAAFMDQLWSQVGNNCTFDYVSLTQQRGLRVAFPPLAEQKAIAHILGALDDKIELNRKMNVTLEAMARALFKSWFVDFDPVRAKLDGRQPAGMDAATAALFPSEFQESELGPIPKGWKIGTIGDATSLIIDHRGKTPKKMGSDWSEIGIPAISAKNVKKGRLIRPEMFNYVSEELYERWMKDKLAVGDILITSEAPLGEVYYLALQARYCLSQRLFALRTNALLCESIFLYYWLESASCQADIINRGTGTTVEGIRQSELRKVPVLLPPIHIQKAAAKCLSAWTKKVHQNEEQSRTLANLRDTLLPKLLSGELSVPEVMKEVADV